jgi:hypothetical protein
MTVACANPGQPHAGAWVTDDERIEACTRPIAVTCLHRAGTYISYKHDCDQAIADLGSGDQARCETC